MSSSNATVKKTMKKTATPAPAPVAGPTPTPTATSAPVAATPTPAKTIKAAKTEAPAPAAPVVPPVATATAVDAASASSEMSLSDEIKTLREQLTTIRETATAALSALKRVEKRAAAEVKEARKSKRKARVDENGERVLSNFEIPVPISDELSALLGGPKNNVMAHKDVTREIHKYLNDNNLRHGHVIKPNEPLRKLLRLGENEDTDIFRLQRLLKHHYPKSLRPAKAT